MPSAAGKRVGRVLAGVKPEAGDKPGLPRWYRLWELAPAYT